MSKGSRQVLSDEQTRQKSLRLWPGVVALILQWPVRFGLPVVVPGTAEFAVLAGLLGGLVTVVWWAFFSRAPRSERWGGIVLMIVAMVATSRSVHESILTGMRGMMFPVFAMPVLSLALVIWAVASRPLTDRVRRVTMVVTILLACGVWTLLRSEGITGEAGVHFRWRWSETHEDRLLAQADDEPMQLYPSKSVAENAAGKETDAGTETATETGATTEAEWPGFRGPNRDGVIRGVRIETDWTASPPVELWRRSIGPGCSSFAVRGRLLYTQEQRGEDEVVACYSMATGKPVWKHRDEARFWDSHAGAGPRGTPTLSNDRVYTLGATGILNVLDADDGAVVWSRNAVTDTKVKDPGWGFTSSPLVLDDLVVVAVAGKLAAYDIATGEPRWFGSDGGNGYSSPHLVTIDGVAQVLLMSKLGASSFSPADGKLLWEHPWPEERIVQPALIADGDLMLSGPKGLRRITVANGADGWTVQEHWTSAGLKPNFNDFVVHEGHAYGYNGPSLACIDIADGGRKWKDGRYGGQLVLLADQDVLLVLTEKGELALVAAVPEQLTELGRFPAIKGKTWNHPVLVGDVLVVRNTQEMVAFRLPLAAG